MACELVAISEAEGREIAIASKIVAKSRKHRPLEVEEITKATLCPRFRIGIYDTNYWISPAYVVGSKRHGHIAVSVFAGISEDETKLRSFYLSNSQAVWRYLPFTLHDAKGQVIHYGKGYGEESCNVMIRLQEVLAQISTEGDLLRASKTRDRVFYGSANSYRSNIYRVLGENYKLKAQREEDLYAGKIRPGEDGKFPTVKYKPVSCEYAQEVHQGLERLNGYFYRSHGERPEPENMLFYFEDRSLNPQHPNFSCVVTSWQQRSILYGDVSVRVFASIDETYRYIFGLDNRDRAWLGGVEHGFSEPAARALGVKKYGIDPGYFGIPAFEYQHQDKGYGNPKLRKSGYIDMYANFLSRIPLIQEFQRIFSRMITPHS